MGRFFKWIKDSFSGEYMQRQMYMMGNLGLFWLILVAMFAVPLLGTFVVVLIKGVIDFRYLILIAGIVVFSLIVYFACKAIFQLFRQIRQDGFFSFREAQRRSRMGEQVQLTCLGGLFSISMGSPGNGETRLPSATAPLSLPGRPDDTPLPDPVRQLKDLQALHEDGIVDSDEFEALKKTIIQQATACPWPKHMASPQDPLLDANAGDQWELDKTGSVHPNPLDLH